MAKGSGGGGRAAGNEGSNAARLAAFNARHSSGGAVPAGERAALSAFVTQARSATYMQRNAVAARLDREADAGHRLQTPTGWVGAATMREAANRLRAMR
jgi:hypothetical protein